MSGVLLFCLNIYRVQGLRMGFGIHRHPRAGQHFDLFDSIFDRVKTVTTQHIVYACRT